MFRAEVGHELADILVGLCRLPVLRMSYSGGRVAAGGGVQGLLQ